MKVTPPCAALLALGLILSPGAGRAADEHDANHNAAAGHAEKPPSLFPERVDLGVWSLVVFGLLLLILSRTAWPQMIEGLRKREENIASALAEAKKTREEAHALHQQIEADRQSAGEQVRLVIEEARRDAEKLRTTLETEGRSTIEAERDRLHREIDLAKDQAIQEIWKQSVQLAVLISKKAIGHDISPETHRQLMDSALAELQNTDAAQQAYASSQA